MEMQEKIEKARKDIWQAIEDYGRHSNLTDVLDDVTDSFVDRLAEDSVKAKQELREMFRKSPTWNEALDALVINGTRTHDPNYDIVYDLAYEILDPAFDGRCDSDDLKAAIKLFTQYGGDHSEAIAAIGRLAPKAYAPGKKKSRIFKAMCQALGIADETAGSRFQHLYAQLADELSAKKISFKLYVSLNPAHFVTMSNPKQDKRGNTMTSCHSFNSDEYQYNNGCSGYARDNCTMIAFTVSDPNEPETLNNRKTTRQLYMYRPGNGLLLQSRMYNTSGGTEGAQTESKLYRDLIQREISECEGMPNLWKTFKYYNNDRGINFRTGDGFGGYPDWTYSNFAAMVSLRHDHELDYRVFNIGTWGLCISCGQETSVGLYCEDCNDDGRAECEECGDRYSEDDLYTVYSSSGREMQVCRDCRDEYYEYCEDCEEYYHRDAVTQLANGEYVCNDCRDRHYRICDECGEWFHQDDMSVAVDANGCEVHICNGCRDYHYVECDDCGRYVRSNHVTDAHREGVEVSVCPDCISSYAECDECGDWYHDDDLRDGFCPDCIEEKEEAEAV